VFLLLFGLRRFFYILGSRTLAAPGQGACDFRLIAIFSNGVKQVGQKKIFELKTPFLFQLTASRLAPSFSLL
jgi:hypothetical protein